MPNKTKPVNSSMFAYQDDITLVSYCPKKNKSVLLLSTMHSDGTVDAESQKPDIILFYNSTKGGIDTIDQMCGNYSVQRKTKRYPLVVFFHLLNIGGINANVLLNGIDSDREGIRNRFKKKTNFVYSQMSTVAIKIILIKTFLQPIFTKL